MRRIHQRYIAGLTLGGHLLLFGMIFGFFDRITGFRTAKKHMIAYIYERPKAEDMMNRKGFLKRSGWMGIGLLAAPGLANAGVWSANDSSKVLHVLLPAGLAPGHPEHWLPYEGISLPQLGKLQQLHYRSAIAAPHAPHKEVWQNLLKKASVPKTQVLASEYMGLEADLSLLDALAKSPHLPQVLVLGSSDLAHGTQQTYLQSQELVFSKLSKVCKGKGLNRIHLHQLHGRDDFENGHGGYDHSTSAAYQKVWTATFELQQA